MKAHGKTYFQPFVEVPGDTPGAIMARSGHCVSVTKMRALWRFGFLPASDAAVAYGCHIDNEYRGFLWVIALPNGQELSRCYGFALDLEPRFKQLLKGDKK